MGQLNSNEDTATLLKNSVTKVFEEMFDIKVKPLDPSINIQPGQLKPISGCVQLMAENNDGVMIVTIPKETMREILEEVFGDPKYVTDSLIHDSVGELTNVTFSVFKKYLERQGINYSMDIPKVCDKNPACKDLSILDETHNSILIPFMYKEKNFEVSMRLAS